MTRGVTRPEHKQRARARKCGIGKLRRRGLFWHALMPPATLAACCCCFCPQSEKEPMEAHANLSSRRVATYGGRRFWIIVSSPGENANSISGANFISGIKLSDCSTHALANSVSTFERERSLPAIPTAADRNFPFCACFGKEKLFGASLCGMCVCLSACTFF